MTKRAPDVSRLRMLQRWTELVRPFFPDDADVRMEETGARISFNWMLVPTVNQARKRGRSFVIVVSLDARRAYEETDEAGRSAADQKLLELLVANLLHFKAEHDTPMFKPHPEYLMVVDARNIV